MDHLLDAAVHSRQDSLVGVSECIITGMYTYTKNMYASVHI